MHFTPPPYLDPGSASTFFQILIASGLGLLVALASSWSRIKTFFGYKPKQEDEDDSENDSN